MMKDKLTKYNHKTLYYATRKTLLALAVFVGFGAMVAVPTTINLLEMAPKNNLAEVIDSEDSNENEKEISSENIEEEIQQD